MKPILVKFARGHGAYPAGHLVADGPAAMNFASWAFVNMRDRKRRRNDGTALRRWFM
jgi:hypothetical protein